jgi:chaperonin cofactor prefoldin
MTLNVGGVSNTHQFNYNESGGEIQLIDSTGAGPILIDNVSGLARFYKVGTGAMSIGTTGANYLQFITNGSDRLNISSGGSVTASVDMRAPIFYDSNNTAYYVDAASTSVLANLNMATGASSNIFIGRNSTATNYNSISLNGNSADASNMGMTGGGVGDSTLYINSTGGITVRTSSFSNSFSFSGGTFTAPGDVRAPIFYDSNNTAFFFDGASTSVLNVMRANSVQFSSGNEALTLNNSSYLILKDPSNRAAIYLGGTADQNNYYDNTNHYFRDRSGVQYATIAASGMYGAVFYDYNNTGYYVDPNGTSNLYRTNGDGFAASQFLCGTTNYGDQVNGSTWYGIGRSTIAGWTPGGMVQAAGYTGLRLRGAYSVIDLDGPVGANLINFTTDTARFIGNVRATIFYDIDNTGYYVDAASTSNLYQLSGVVTYGSYGSLSITGQTNNYAGIAFPTKSSTLMIGDGGATPSGFYFGNSAWGMYCFSNGGIYTHIMYDLDNSAYRCDPTGTSVLSSIALGGSTSVPQGVMWVNGDIWTTGNSRKLAFSTDGSGDGTPNGSIRCDGTGAGDVVIQNWSGGASNDNFWVFGASRNAACAGNITAYYSDERLKTKTGTLDNALDKVRSLEGFLYVENELAQSVGYNNDKQQVGLSAQQVQAVLPEAVALAPFDYERQEDDTIASKSGENYLTVDYSRLVPLLVEAIKELENKVKALEAKE